MSLFKRKQATAKDEGLASDGNDCSLSANVGDKLSIYDYERKYVRRQNVRGAKFLINFAAFIVGVLLFVCLFFFSYRVWEINEYAGYAAIAVCAVLYILFFLAPLIKIMRSDYFIVNVNANTASSAKRHNKKLRRDIADKIIDVTAKVEGVGWYDSYTVGQLAISVRCGDDEGVKRNLSELFNGSVKKSAHELIFKSSLKSATYSALSQTAKVDAALVVFVNMQLIKDLVFLYGFRPSDARLVKIFIQVLQNSLIAYGLGGLNVGNTVVKTMGDAVRGIPVLGTAIAALVDSSVQGLTNGALTAVIGFQTIKYLNDEYRLQNILDGIEDVDAEAEVVETCDELAKELKRKKTARAA